MIRKSINKNISMRQNLKLRNIHFIQKAIQKKQAQRKRLHKTIEFLQTKYETAAVNNSHLSNKSKTSSIKKNLAQKSLETKRASFNEFVIGINKLKTSLNWGLCVQSQAFYTAHKVKPINNMKNDGFQCSSIRRVQMQPNPEKDTVRCLSGFKKTLNLKEALKKNNTSSQGFNNYRKVKTLPQLLNSKAKRQNVYNEYRPWSRYQGSESDQQSLQVLK